jgi:DNA processing protein
VYSPLSKGCHRLLRNGATLVESLDDILVEIAGQLGSELLANGAPGIEQAQLRTAAEAAPWLDFSPRTLDELLPRSGLTAAELSSMLLHLEIEGTVEALPGGRYCRLGKRS